MTMSAIARKSNAGPRCITRVTGKAARWLGLAASPTFALMAWVSAGEVSQSMICSASLHTLSAGGMPGMYLLMSLFHLPCWLTFLDGSSPTGSHLSQHP